MEGAIKNRQSRDISNIWHKTQNEDKQSKTKKMDNADNTTKKPEINPHAVESK